MIEPFFYAYPNDFSVFFHMCFTFVYFACVFLIIAFSSQPIKKTIKIKSNFYLHHIARASNETNYFMDVKRDYKNIRCGIFIFVV